MTEDVLFLPLEEALRRYSCRRVDVKRLTPAEGTELVVRVRELPEGIELATACFPVTPRNGGDGDAEA